MIISITHENIELTEAIKNYAEEKLSKLEEYMPNILEVRARLGKTTNHHHKGEVFECKASLEFPGGVLRAEHVSDDLYKAINECKETIKREIAKFKETHRNH